MKYEFIETHKAAYKITEICECFSIKPSGYYAWTHRYHGSHYARYGDARLGAVFLQ
jgi:hypothetical protein